MKICEIYLGMNPFGFSILGVSENKYNCGGDWEKEYCSSYTYVNLSEKGLTFSELFPKNQDQ